MKILTFAFSCMIVAGFFLLFVGMAGSHGHFRFRPHMLEDWIMFGTPLIGVIGFVVVTIVRIRNRNN
jgi:hypothetical protein